MELIVTAVEENFHHREALPARVEQENSAGFRKHIIHVQLLVFVSAE